MTWKAGDVNPEWGDRPLTAREAVALNSRRLLTPEERIEARHWLQQLAEQARTVRNAMDPVTGVPAVTVSAWATQYESLRRELDRFTRRVIENKPAAGGVPDRNA